MKISTRLIVLGMMAVWTGSQMPVMGQTCKELFDKAEKLRKKEKWDDAISIYRQVKSCNDKSYGKDCDYQIEYINKNRPIKKTQQPTVFKLSTNEIVIPCQGAEWNVYVYGGGSWSYTCEGDEWCKVKRSGNKLIISALEQNESVQPRDAVVTVQSGTKKQTVKIINEGAPEKLRSSVSKVSFPAKGESTDVDIYANVDWQVDETPEWVKTEKGKNNLRFIVDANPQNRERTSVVKLVSKSDSIVLIQVYQGAADEKLSFSKNDLLFGPDGGDEYVKVYTNADGWKFHNMPDWVQVTDMGNDMIRIHCTPNQPINERREGSINVTTGLQSLGINIAQEPKPIVNLLPLPTIGGRRVSFGLSAGLMIPNIATSSGGNFTGSVVNYALGNSLENASFKTSMGFSVNLFADIQLYKNLYLIAGVGFSRYTYKNEFTADVERKIAQNSNHYLRGVTQNNYTEDYTMSMLEVPILASYRFPISKLSHVQVNLGPVVNFGLSAKMKLAGNTDSEKMKPYLVKDHNFTDIVYLDKYTGIHYRGSGEMDLYGKSVDFTETYAEGINQDFNRSQELPDSPLKKLNFGARLGVTFEYAGVDIGLEYTYMLSNMANKKFWEGDRWKVFNQDASVLMQGYKEQHHYLGIKLGYTFRN